MKLLNILGLISLVAAPTGCDLLTDEYYADYTAECPALVGRGPRVQVLHIAKNMGAELNLPVTLAPHIPIGAGIDIYLPLIPGAPPYRPNSSGQIHLGTMSGNKIGILLIKVPKEEDDLARKIRTLIVGEIEKSNCSILSLDRVHAILM